MNANRITLALFLSLTIVARIGATKAQTAPSIPPYATNFAGAVETPMSEGGVWLQGGVVGIDWGDINKVPGLAYSAGQAHNFGDAIAILSGTWNADQQAQGTIRVRTAPTRCCVEAELHLRMAVRAHFMTGYEVTCSVVMGTAYLQIGRYDGKLNDFPPDPYNEAHITCRDGDVLKATITGNPPTITAYLNGEQVAQATDASPGYMTGGSPGIGFYNCPLGGTAKSRCPPAAPLSSFGFSDFSASNLDPTP